MFAKSKIIRLAVWACVAATWLPIGNGFVQPAQADAAEIIRIGPIVRVPPVVRVGPIVRVPPVVTVGPVYPRPWLPRYYPFGYWHGYRIWR
jgi:hypothetical protein